MLKEIYAQIKQAKKILIVSHVNPDGDTLGAMCAMKLALGKNADMLIQLPRGVKTHDIYDFLPYINSVLTLDKVQDIYDLIITVDVASVDRLIGRAKTLFEKTKNTICFDHHETNPNYAKYNFVLPNASSCCEVLYEFFKANGIKITKEIADCLYVGILTDTGSFRYEAVSAKTFKVASELTSAGASPSELAKKCYDSKPLNMVLLHAHCVNNAKFLNENKIAYTFITKKDMEKFNAKNEYTEGIAETIRSIKSVELCFTLKEVDENTTKVSFRSKYTDVTKITSVFGGGGHIHAAGCTIRLPLNKALEAVVKEIDKQQKVK